jgi:prepilin-type N-terminal cleavage/methylation domain-containing protein
MKQLLKTYWGGGFQPLEKRGKCARGKRAGFTLVEVIVVLVILAILAAIAIPALTGYIDKAGYASFKADAREMTIAYQTLISEAYADPSSHFPEGTDTGKLFIGGYQIAYIYKTEYTNPADSDMYLYSLSLTGNSHDPGAEPLSGFGRLSALTNLSPIPAIPSGSIWSDVSFPMHMYINKSCQIAAFVYVDPKSFKVTEYNPSYNIRAEGIYYTYNMTPTDWGGGTYDPNAGYQLFKVYDDQELHETEITPL